MTRHLDVVVIGAGPAGLTAARVVATAGLSCLLIDKMGPGGQLMNMGEVHDCPGLDPGTTGPDLLARLVDETMAAGAGLAVDEVSGINGGSPWQIAASEEYYTATAIVIATGLARGNLAVADEELYEGTGISYCATCDGPLFAGKRVVVEGGHDWAVQEAIELAHVAAHVTVITEYGITASSDRAAQIAGLANITLLNGRIAGIGGEPSLQKVVIETGTDRITLAAAGLFPCMRRKPMTSFLKGLLHTTPGGHIEAGHDQHASQSGIFACGDVESPAERIATAIADGGKAGQNAVRWVTSKVSGV